MSKNIHATAIIDAKAELDSSVEVGAYTIIEAGVKIDAGTRIGSHAVIKGPTTIGKNNHIFQYVSLGEQPQDKKYIDEATTLEIGDNNTIREFCTFNRGTIQDKGVTKVGNDNWIMAYVHLAHDCDVGNHTILANNATLAGHVDIHDYAILGGYTLVHQFCKVGAHAFTAASSVLFKDVPPYVTVGSTGGSAVEPHGINTEGLRRRAFTKDEITQIKRAYKVLYRNGLSLDDAKNELETMQKECDKIKLLSDFLSLSTRGIIR